MTSAPGPGSRIVWCTSCGRKIDTWRDGYGFGGENGLYYCVDTNTANAVSCWETFCRNRPSPVRVPITFDVDDPEARANMMAELLP